MGCCGDTNELKNGMQKISQTRSCTDIFFLLLWVASWAGVCLIISLAQKAGANPYKLIRGVSIDGDICGYDNAVNLDYVAWPNPIQDYDRIICVSSCDATDNYGNSDASVPTLTRMAYRYKTSQLGYYCLPTTAALDLLPSVSVDWESSDITRQCSQAAADTAATWHALAISAGAALIITFLFVAFLGKCAGCVLLTAIAAIIGGSSLISAFLIVWGLDSTHRVADPNLAKAALVFGVVLAAMVLIALCVLIAMYTRIRIAVEVVKEAAHAVGDMKSIICFPLVPFIITLCYIALWAACMIYVFSVTETAPLSSLPSSMRTLATTPASMWAGSSVSTNANPLTYYPTYRTNYWRGLAAYLFFHLLWQIQFFFYFGYLTFAGATADWYFTPRDKEGYKIVGGPDGLSRCPVCRSCCRSLRYHIGTVALSSLIIAVIQFIRAVLLYVEKKTVGSPPNKLQQIVFCVIQCCLKCVQCCMDKINKNALIWVAITGDSFGTAACSSFQLLWKNIGRTLAIMSVSSVLIFISKFSVAAITAGIALAIIPRVYDNITSPLMPCIIIFIIAYVVCSIFMVVFHAIIDTIFLCFLIDEDVNTRAQKPMMATKSLANLVSSNKELQEESEQHARKMQERYDRLDAKSSKVTPGPVKVTR